jgi:hypothetical protein
VRAGVEFLEIFVCTGADRRVQRFGGRDPGFGDGLLCLVQMPKSQRTRKMYPMGAPMLVNQSVSPPTLLGAVDGGSTT